jgi:hypothetical protein
MSSWVSSPWGDLTIVCVYSSRYAIPEFSQESTSWRLNPVGYLTSSDISKVEIKERESSAEHRCQINQSVTKLNVGQERNLFSIRTECEWLVGGPARGFHKAVQCQSALKLLDPGGCRN